MATPYTTQKDNISPSELARFAVCLLHLKNINAAEIDWNAASADFNPSTKPQSFKTVTLRALKRVLNASESSEAADVTGNEGGANGKNKRKAAAVDDDADDNDDEGAEASGKGRKKKGTASGKRRAHPKKSVKAVEDDAGDNHDEETDGGANIKTED